MGAFVSAGAIRTMAQVTPSPEETTHSNTPMRSAIFSHGGFHAPDTQFSLSISYCTKYPTCNWRIRIFWFLFLAVYKKNTLQNISLGLETRVHLRETKPKYEKSGKIKNFFYFDTLPLSHRITKDAR